MTVMAATGFRSQCMVIIEVNWLVAVERDQRGRADIYRNGTPRDGLSSIRSMASDTCNDELNFTISLHVFESRTRLTDCRESRYSRVFLQQLGRCTGASLHAVNYHDLGPCLDREFHVVKDSARAELDENWHLP